MGNIKKQSIQNTIISYVGMGLGYLNTILLMPNVLQPEQIGLTKLLIQISVLFANLSALGFPYIAIKYFPFFRNKAKQHYGFLFLFLTIPLAGFLLITLLYILFKPAVIQHFAGKDAELLLKYYYHIILLAFFSLYFILQDAYLKTQYKTVVSSFIQDFFLRLLITVSICVYAFKLINFETFVYLFIGVNCVVTLILTGYIIFLKQFFVKFSKEAFSIQPVKEIISFGLFSFAGLVSSNIILIIDSIMILNYRSMAEVGIYNVATLVTSAIMIPARSFYKTVMPQVADYWAENNMTGMKSVYQRVTSINLVVGCLLFIGIWANLDSLFSFMPAEYAQGKYVFFFMGLARVFDMATGINGIILLTSPKYRYDLFFNILLAVSLVVSNYIFIPIYGIMGAAFASMLAVIAINSIRLGFVLVIYKMQPFVSRSVLIVGIGAATYFLSVLIPYMGNTFTDIVFRSAFISIVYISLILGLKASPDAGQLWAGFVQKLKRK